MKPNLRFWTKQLLLVSLCGKNKMFSPALCVSLILFIAPCSVFAHIETHICSELGERSRLFLIPRSWVTTQSPTLSIQMIQFQVSEQTSLKCLGGKRLQNFSFVHLNHKTKSRDFMNYIKTNKLNFTSHSGQQQHRMELHKSFV